MIPRRGRLEIHHDTGDVIVRGVDADIDASIRAGSLLLQLPEGGKYAFDTRCTSGGIRSAFAGPHRHAAITGESFTTSEAAPARKIHLRAGIGGIEIQKEVRLGD